MATAKDIFNKIRGYASVLISTAAQTFNLAAPVVATAVIAGTGAAIGAGVGVGMALFLALANGMASAGDQRKIKQHVRDFALPILAATAVIGAMTGPFLPALTGAVAGLAASSVGLGAFLASERHVKPKDMKPLDELRGIGAIIFASAVGVLGGLGYGAYKVKDVVRESPALRFIYPDTTKTTALDGTITETFAVAVRQAGQAATLKPVAATVLRA